VRDTELMAKWFEDIGEGVRRRIEDLDEDALEWRADDRGNNVRETVWHMARWIDVLTRFLAGTQPSTERWFTDGWAERTGSDPRGIGDDGLGVLSGYTFENVKAAAKAVRRATGIVQGCFGHIGEIDALLAIRKRSAQRASA